MNFKSKEASINKVFKKNTTSFEPVKSSIEDTKIIRKMSEVSKRDVPIVALTASAMIEDKNHVLKAGMNDHVAKPFNPDELFNKMKMLIREKVS